MPNWCNNGLTLTHEDPAMIKRAVEAFNKGELLNEFVPVPEELANPESTSFGGDNAEEKNQLRQSLLDKYGYESWYDYCVSEWGTKWDVSPYDNVNYEEGSNTVTLGFDTAWSPPTEWYAKVEALGFQVEGYYYEPGMGFVGVWRDGYDDCYDYSGTHSTTVRSVIGDELDDYFNISESMAEWEAENEEPDELQEFLVEGAEAKGLTPADPIKF